MRSLGIHLRALYLDDPKILINETRLKTAVLKWHLDLPGASELNQLILIVMALLIQSSHCIEPLREGLHSSEHRRLYAVVYGKDSLLMKYKLR